MYSCTVVQLYRKTELLSRVGITSVKCFRSQTRKKTVLLAISSGNYGGYGHVAYRTDPCTYNLITFGGIILYLHILKACYGKIYYGWPYHTDLLYMAILAHIDVCSGTIETTLAGLDNIFLDWIFARSVVLTKKIY